MKMQTFQTQSANGLANGKVLRAMPAVLPASSLRARECFSARKSFRTASLGGDAVQGWVDLAQLVSGGGGFKSAYKELAQDIGSDIYIDVNGWHLFLRDVSAGPDLKLNQALAQQIGEATNNGKLDLDGLLKQIPVKLGGGKAKISLYDAIPSFSLDDFHKIVEKFQDN